MKLLLNVSIFWKHCPIYRFALSYYNLFWIKQLNMKKAGPGWLFVF